MTGAFRLGVEYTMVMLIKNNVGATRWGKDQGRGHYRRVLG